MQLPKSRRRLALIAMTALVAVACGSAVEDDRAEPPAASTSDSQASREAGDSTTTTSDAASVIPGLAPVDVYLNLEDRGFTCDGPTSGELYATFTCEDDQGLDTVVIYSPKSDVSAVLQVEVSTFTSAGRALMGFVATAPYEGSMPEEARAWVEGNFDSVRQGEPVTETFGSVRYNLLGAGEARTLEIGQLAP